MALHQDGGEPCRCLNAGCEAMVVKNTCMGGAGIAKGWSVQSQSKRQRAYNDRQVQGLIRATRGDIKFPGYAMMLTRNFRPDHHLTVHRFDLRLRRICG